MRERERENKRKRGAGQGRSWGRGRRLAGSPGRHGDEGLVLLDERTLGPQKQRRWRWWLRADEGSEEVAHEVGLQAVLGRRGRREREWSDGFLELLMRLDAVVDRAGVPIEEGGWWRWVCSGRNEGIPMQRGLEEWRRRDGIDGTRLLGSRVGLLI